MLASSPSVRHQWAGCEEKTSFVPDLGWGQTQALAFVLADSLQTGQPLLYRLWRESPARLGLWIGQGCGRRLRTSPPLAAFAQRCSREGMEKQFWRIFERGCGEGGEHTSPAHPGRVWEPWLFRNAHFAQDKEGWGDEYPATQSTHTRPCTHTSTLTLTLAHTTHAGAWRFQLHELIRGLPPRSWSV